MKFQTVSITLFIGLFAFNVNCSANEFIDNKNDTVTDISTGLTWQAKDDNTRRDWETASKYCQDLNLAGLDDWRLPNFYNLRTIRTASTDYPAIDKDSFPQAKAARYWSSTYLPYYDKMAYFVNFGAIETTATKEQRLEKMEMKNRYYSRCVRGKRAKQKSSRRGQQISPD